MAQGPGSISIMENFGRLVKSTSLSAMLAVLCMVIGGALLPRAACAQGADTAVAFDVPAQPLGTALVPTPWPRALLIDEIDKCDLDLANYQTAYWGANLARLKKIKAAFDPDNVFRHAQSIPVA